ncbi:MAG: hypothetical protein KDA93_27295 [Planctomycetaceae bacterium]|nr:hypothetical protein [Planctomycetaceae bacterium]
MYDGFKGDMIRVGILLTVIGGAVFAFYTYSNSLPDQQPQRGGATRSTPVDRSVATRDARRQEFGNFSLWWDGIPEFFHQNRVDTGQASNIAPEDYTGAESCKKCHEKNYNLWSNHAHRWMNALADESTVKGDFSGDYEMDYLGGQGRFYRDGDGYFMELTRDDVRHVYEVTQTIGSRFYQYYVGQLREGPEPSDHPRYTEDHVLPVGYWLDRKEWVPIVHVHDRENLHDQDVEELHDPFVMQEYPPWDDWGTYCDSARDLYRSQCNFCHTTFPVGDMMVRDQQKVGFYVPVKVHLSMPDYVSKARPDLWKEGQEPWDMEDAEFASILREFRTFEAPEHAVSLGVGCEACHLGAKEHAENKDIKPSFFPTSPDLVIQAPGGEMELGRTHDNVNWACGRCHVGPRPKFAAGISTWNSTEYADALDGSCYSELTCIECHNPHETIGPKWTRTPAEDDASCLKCHQEFEPEAARVAHTHHPVDTEGSRCMNCHMPRLNEGLQDIVRTHTIFSPTNHEMIEANEPNACNMCHVEQPIDWTLDHLKEWYDVTYDESQLVENYPDRDLPTALGWLKSDRRYVRQIAADALTRQEATWALSELFNALDDPYLLNRQFARIGLESMLDVELVKFGYRFYMTEDERHAPLEQIRDELLPKESPSDADVN